MSARDALPNRRPSEVVAFAHEGVRYIAEFSRFADGRLGEVFIDGGKVGSAVSTTSRDAAVVLSIALQYGVPVGVIRDALTRSADGSPAGPVGVLLKLTEEG